MIRRIVPVFLALALAGCGFHLRNALVLPPDLGPVKVVSADRYSPLAESLAQALVRSGAEIAPADAADTAVLDLVAERWGDTPISVDARGRAQEYSLRYAVIFEVRGRDGTAILPRQAVELSRDYISVPTNSIGTEGERDILVKELRREMSASILRRIDAVARRQFSAAGVASSPAATTGTVPAAMESTAVEPVPGETAPEPTDGGR
ncbi:LPS assembly lipoprotein LptE [Marilutibacter chinensis]|uniref:LPS-assembly lipoprotein LptE n=1 Tax=Marilutibacter chinensis TaxID=2912247 RepID=A0ABS9HXE0_9GAMM|nr:LPS assembly lipoprotein LptE [Lysobacter chinensis]MCF7222697.1 LPS assembly lipoprotein LptE [Lysobacter chinensis]